MTTNDLWASPPVRSLPVRGPAERLPVNRLFFVGRHYPAHAIEMALRPMRTRSSTATPAAWTSLIEGSVEGVGEISLRIRCLSALSSRRIGLPHQLTTTHWRY